MPALSPKGQDLGLKSLPNGTVDMMWDASGNPVFNDSESFRVTSLLVCHMGQWFADSTGKRGSQLHTIKNDQKSLTVAQMESYALQALTPAVSGGYISNVSAVATRLGSGKFRLIASYRSRSGKKQSMPYELET